MQGRLGGRVAVVFGAARGIGAAIAERMAEEGARLTIADTNQELGEQAARRLGCAFSLCDVRDKSQIVAVLQRVVGEFSRLDILCQNAGIFPQTDLVDIAVDEWDGVLEVNLRGCFLAVQAALGPMRRQRYGRIVLTSSITGPRVVPPGHAHYAASKAGINGLIRAAALENAAFGITVNGVEPGNILTEGMQSERSADYIAAMAQSIPMKRLGEPCDVAHAVLYLVSDEASYVTGTTILVDGGQVLPEALILAETKQ